MLRYHLGLLIPEPEDQLGISVGGQIAHWSEGQSLVFDDTFEHSAWNDTDADACRALSRRGARAPRADEDVQQFMIKAIGYSPFIQDARRRHEAWERRFERMRGAGN